MFSIFFSITKHILFIYSNSVTIVNVFSILLKKLKIFSLVNKKHITLVANQRAVYHVGVEKKNDVIARRGKNMGKIY